MRLRLKNKVKGQNTSEPSEKKIENSVQTVADPLVNFEKILVEDNTDLSAFGEKVLSLISHEKEILQGIFLLSDRKKENPVLRFLAGYACLEPASEDNCFRFGEGLPGQVAVNGKLMNLNEVPQGYITIRTGLGEASPGSLLIFPLIHENQIMGVIELASFKKFDEKDEAFFSAISPLIGKEIKRLSGKKTAKGNK